MMSQTTGQSWLQRTVTNAKYIWRQNQSLLQKTGIQVSEVRCRLMEWGPRTKLFFVLVQSSPLTIRLEKACRTFT